MDTSATNYSAWQQYQWYEDVAEEGLYKKVTMIMIWS